MPDGDKLYGLSHAFEKPYEEICEWHFPPSTIAVDLLDALRNVLIRYGDGPVKALESAAEFLDQLPIGPLLNRAIDWGKINAELSRIVREVSAPLRPTNLVLEECKAYVVARRYDESIGEALRPLVRAYVNRVWRANFEDCVQYENHYNDIDQATFERRMDEVRPYVQEGLDLFSEQIIRRGTVSRLRRVARPETTMAPDTDLLSV